jgi:hypothetical protein
MKFYFYFTSSDKLINYWPANFHCPSTFPQVENAQQVPTDPWSLTGVTAPWSTQLNCEGIGSLDYSISLNKYLSEGNYWGSLGFKRIRSLNS